MATKNSLINKISDYLEDRQKTTNFGTCKRCSKKVYWSTTKVASHIRSGHCSGTSEDEIQRFKQEFIYDSPKNLVHKSAIAKQEKQDTVHVISFKKETSPSSQQKAKRSKLELNESGEEHLLEQTDSTEMIYEESGNCDDSTTEKIEEIYYVTESSSFDNLASSEAPKTSTDPLPTPANKEEKFISVVYPQYKGRSKLQLIDEILDLKRRNELLQVKVKTYEKTINRLI